MDHTVVIYAEWLETREAFRLFEYNNENETIAYVKSLGDIDLVQLRKEGYKKLIVDFEI